MAFKMLYFVMTYMTILKFSTTATTASPVEKAVNVIESTTWAFDKYSFPEQESAMYDGKKGSLRLKNFDFGPFGASQVSLGIKTPTALKSISKKLYIHFDEAKNHTAEFRFVGNIRSTQDNVLTFDVSSPNGVHDVYISLPLDVKPTDLSYVQFYTENPPQDQWYYLLSLSSSKALRYTGLVGTYTLDTIISFMFKFEKVDGGGFKIIHNGNSVLTVKGGSTSDRASLLVEEYTGRPYQIWFIQPITGGFRFHPKHFFSKCLTLINARNAEGAEVGSSVCNEGPEQTWRFLKAC